MVTSSSSSRVTIHFCRGCEASSHFPNTAMPNRSNIRWSKVSAGLVSIAFSSERRHLRRMSRSLKVNSSCLKKIAAITWQKSLRTVSPPASTNLSLITTLIRRVSPPSKSMSLKTNMMRGEISPKTRSMIDWLSLIMWGMNQPKMQT